MTTKQLHGTAQWRSLAALAAFVATLLAAADAPAGPSQRAKGELRGDVLLGEWWTERDEGRVLFTKDPDGTYRGTTTCCTPREASPENPGKDIHNPDPKLRARSTVGIVIIWKLAYADGAYSGGYVYNPRDGKTYRIAARVIDQDTIQVRGYLWLPLIGQSQLWRRARATPSA